MEKEMVLFENKGTTREMLEVLRNVSEPALQRALTVRLLFTPPVVARLSTASKKGKKTMKGVNCFVGFRCKYQLSQT